MPNTTHADLNAAIRAGITTAIRDADRVMTEASDFYANAHPYLTALANLPDRAVDVIAVQVLEALAALRGEDGQIVITPAATAMLSLSPADVIARAARDAMNDAAQATNPDDDVYERVPDADTFVTFDLYPAGEDRREVREFLFRVQAMYGCRVRVSRPASDGSATFKVAGTPAQRRALMSGLLLVTDAAAPLLEGWARGQRREFWATLGDLVAGTADAADLIAANTATHEAATGLLERQFGRVRNLTRTAAAQEGAVYEAAQQVAPTLTHA